MNQAMITKKQMISLSYVIGGILLMFFAGRIGSNGIGYIAMVFELLHVFLFLVSEEITDFVSKMIRGKKAKGLYKDAYNVRRRVLVIHFITGVVLSILFLVLSEVFAAGLFKIPYIGICMRIVAPIIFLRSMETVFQGSFQSSGSQLPTVLCAFIRLAFFFGLGLLLSGKYIIYGQKVSGLLMNDDFTGMYGAIGLCIAALIAEIPVFLFQLFLYFIVERKKEKKRCKEGLQTTEDLRTTLYYYYGKVLLIFLSQLFYRLPILLGIIFAVRGLQTPFDAAYSVGSYYGVFFIVCSIPVMLVEAGTHVMQGKLAYYAGKAENRGVREVIANGMHFCVIFAIFLGAVFLTMSDQMTAVFMGGDNEVLAGYFKIASVLVMIQILSNYGIGLLKSMNQKRYVLLCTFLGALVALITCFVGKKSGFEVYDYMIYAMIFAGLVTGVFAIILTTLGRRIGIEPVTSFVVPLICGSVVGLLMMLIGNLMTPHLGNLVCIILCVVFGFVIYVFLLGLTRNIHENEISTMYGELGKRIVGLIFK